MYSHGIVCIDSIVTALQTVSQLLNMLLDEHLGIVYSTIQL